MNLSEVTKLFAFTVGGLVLSVSAYAVTDFTETFETDSSGWLNESFGATDYFSTGGVDDSGYISVGRDANFVTAPPAIIPTPVGNIVIPPLELLFRGNAGSASGDAFVGNWLAAGVETFSVAVRHNFDETVNFYARIAAPAPPGAGASLANTPTFAVAPDTWTNLTIDIDPAAFDSFGSSSFNGVFSSVQNLQLGFYLPGSTAIPNFRMDIDNVSITIPEPASLGVMGLMFGGLLSRRRRA